MSVLFSDYCSESETESPTARRGRASWHDIDIDISSWHRHSPQTKNIHIMSPHNTIILLICKRGIVVCHIDVMFGIHNPFGGLDVLTLDVLSLLSRLRCCRRAWDCVIGSSLWSWGLHAWALYTSRTSRGRTWRYLVYVDLFGQWARCGAGSGNTTYYGKRLEDPGARRPDSGERWERGSTVHHSPGSRPAVIKGIERCEEYNNLQCLTSYELWVTSDQTASSQRQ